MLHFLSFRNNFLLTDTNWDVFKDDIQNRTVIKTQLLYPIQTTSWLYCIKWSRVCVCVCFVKYTRNID